MSKRVTKLNCLSFIYPKIAKEWNYRRNKGLSPCDVTSRSNLKVWWICSFCKNEWKSRIDSRKISGCPKCASFVKFKNFKRSLAYKNSKLSKEWHPTKNGKLTPQMVLPGSHKTVWWICKKCNNEWRATIKERNNGNGNCFNCRCLAYKNPQLSKEWHPTKNGKLTPYLVSNTCGKKVWWKCSRCGNVWKAYVSNRVAGHGCECYRNVVLLDGTICGSMTEAIFYLKLVEKGIKFYHNGFYGREMGKHKYDFYIPKNKKYIEVTSYHGGSQRYKKYLETIALKKKYVEEKLKANFEFVDYIPTKKEYKYIKEKMKKFI